MHSHFFRNSAIVSNQKGEINNVFFYIFLEKGYNVFSYLFKKYTNQKNIDYLSFF